MNHNDYDIRGNVYDRRRRREWLWEQHKQEGLKTIKCFHCPQRLGPNSFEVDRYPICGHDGGRYTRNNIVPSCRKCNATRCIKKNCRKQLRTNKHG